MRHSSQSESSGVSRAEIVIVGAGPAGSLAAARLQRLGHDVLLLESARFPRDKVCGDVLLPLVDRSLRAVGLELEKITPDAAIVPGCRYRTTRGREVVGAFRDPHGSVRPWRVLPRRLLDERLARHAAACGADLREDHRLVDIEFDPARRSHVLAVETPQGRAGFEARVVIGADGATSTVARRLALRPGPADGPDNRFVAVRAYAPWSGPGDLLRIFATADLLPGCAWIVPGPDGMANIGVGMAEADRRARGIRLREAFAQTLGAHVDLSTATRLVGWQLPAGSLARRTTADGAILVGDAAGFIDPFTGHGIHNAMRSGLAAAAAAHTALETGETCAASPALQGYETWWRGTLGREFVRARRLQRLHARAPLIEAVMALAGRSPRFADRVMGVVGHASLHHEVYSPRFLLDALRR